MPIVLLAVAAVILGGVVVAALGRGGELVAFASDRPPFDPDIATAADVVLLRPPSALWGYSVQATDEALNRIAQAVTERDVEIAALRRQLGEMRMAAGQGPAEDVAPSTSPLPAVGQIPGVGPRSWDDPARWEYPALGDPPAPGDRPTMDDTPTMDDRPATGDRPPGEVAAPGWARELRPASEPHASALWPVSPAPPAPPGTAWPVTSRQEPDVTRPGGLPPARGLRALSEADASGDTGVVSSAGVMSGPAVAGDSGPAGGPGDGSSPGGGSGPAAAGDSGPGDLASSGSGPRPRDGQRPTGPRPSPFRSSMMGPPGSQTRQGSWSAWERQDQPGQPAGQPGQAGQPAEPPPGPLGQGSTQRQAGPGELSGVPGQQDAWSATESEPEASSGPVEGGDGG